MFYRRFINRKINTKFQTIVRRKVPYLRNKKTYSLKSLVKKYDIGQDIFFDKDPLPNLYYQNEVVLMPKNKNTLFIYWEVREDDFLSLKEKHNVYDRATVILYKNKEKYRKIQGLSRVGSYYVNNVKANRSYIAKLGFENENGDFFEIVSSKRVSTPFGRISNRRASTWAIPYLFNGKLHVNFFDKHNLPEDHVLRLEITDEVLTNSNISLSSPGFDGSSEKFLGSSK